MQFMSKFTVKIVYNYKPVIYGSVKFYGIGPRSQTCSLLTTTRSSQAQGKVFNLLFPKKPEVERNQLQYFCRHWEDCIVKKWQCLYNLSKAIFLTKDCQKDGIASTHETTVDQEMATLWHSFRYSEGKCEQMFTNK